MSDEQLWAAIYDLYSLLVEQKNDESFYQRLFEQHPVIFLVLGMEAAVSFEKSSPNSLPFDPDKNFQPEPDFIGAELPAGNVIVVELKTPFVGDITTARQDGNRAKFKATAETYISQATEYVESIRQRPEAREVVRRVLGIGKIADYRAVLVYGLRAENDLAIVGNLAAQRKIPTQIIFYDDLLDRMIRAYSLARRDVTSRPGWCFVSHINLAPSQLYERAFLAEYGAVTADRISVYLERNSLVFDCCDSHGKRHHMQSPLTGPGPHYIRFEFANDSNGAYMSLNVDNVETDLRLSKNDLNLFPDTGQFTLGADSNGDNGAHFFLLEHYFVNRTMDLSEKLGSFHYFQRKTTSASHCHEFKPQSYMVRQPSGDLAQEREESKPVLRSIPPANGA